MSALASCIYEGVVAHRRREPPVRAFRYPIAMTYVDLSELEQLDELLGPFFSHRRSAPARLRRRDYYGSTELPLERAVGELVQARTGTLPARVRLLTSLRTFGHCFNPVSFYYCFDEREHLHALVAEVTNTPWGERHAYVLEPGGERVAKRLHVSPFMGMDRTYECDAPPPGPTVRVSIRSHRAGERTFEATLALRRRELTRASLVRALARRPLPGAQVQARIYAQALRLRLRGARYHPHPAPGGTA